MCLLAKHFPDYSVKQTNSSEQNWASHSNTNAAMGGNITPHMKELRASIA